MVAHQIAIPQRSVSVTANRPVHSRLTVIICDRKRGFLDQRNVSAESRRGLEHDACVHVALREATSSADVRPTRGAVRREETRSASSPPHSKQLCIVREFWNQEGMLVQDRSGSLAQFLFSQYPSRRIVSISDSHETGNSSAGGFNR